jgi:hypothetical protein
VLSVPWARSYFFDIVALNTSGSHSCLQPDDFVASYNQLLQDLKWAFVYAGSKNIFTKNLSPPLLFVTSSTRYHSCSSNSKWSRILWQFWSSRGQ